MTAVEWLVNEISRDRVGKAIIKTFLEEFEQAKKMENQQMKEMYLKGIENYDPTFKNK